jgi:DNA-directed RNA polymerase subunit RPC12/RpoP
MDSSSFTVSSNTFFPTQNVSRPRSSLRRDADTTTRRKEASSMRCPYCGDRRTEVLKTVYRGHSSYRHRRCRYCGSRFSTQERPVRWSRVERSWPGPRPSRNGWKKHRTASLRDRCEVEFCGVDFKQSSVRRHVDHIVPARLIRRLRAGNPDRRENLECICGTCHGYKLQADHKLCLGDKLGYLEILRTHHFDLARVERALALYGL